MVIAAYPYKILSFLNLVTLINRIREKNWKLEALFPLLEETKSRLRRLGGSLSQDDLNRIRAEIKALASEVMNGVHDLKLINFYDSAILYLYFKMLHNVSGLCNEAHSRLKAKMKQAKSKPKEDLEKAKDDAEEEVRHYQGLVKRLRVSEEELNSAYRSLAKRMEDEKWDAEKLAQHEFNWRHLTMRSMRSLNRKIKVAALMVKRDAPARNYLLDRIKRGAASGEIEPNDVISLAKLAKRAIRRIDADVVYSSKLISKFEDEVEDLKAIVERLKKKISRERGEQAAEEAVKPWNDAVAYLETKVHEDLMQIFRNVFVEQKETLKNPLAA